MSVEHVNREPVERRLARLREAYDDPHVEEIHQEAVPSERFAELEAGARDGYIGGAYCWVVRDPDQAARLSDSMPDDIETDRRVLMILGRGGGEWGLAGGGQEGGEVDGREGSKQASGGRREDGEVDGREASKQASGGSREHGETYEEAAVREVREETSVDCEVTDCFLLRRIRTDSADGEKRLHALYAFFDADYVDGHIAVQPGELNGAAWFAEPPGRMLPANRFRAADFWADYEAADPLGGYGEYWD
jgi:ADP-ribose pyrophosphatase YjhB (NUDIX family)